MKKTVSAILTVILICLISRTAVMAAPGEPTIEGQMPDCYMNMGSGGITLYANASSPDGGMLEYQWYSTTMNDMATIYAIIGEEGETLYVPEKLGVMWYCYAVWNVDYNGQRSTPVYSRLIRVEFYEQDDHEHTYGEWMITMYPTCTEGGIMARECDCGKTERAEIGATGHKWDNGKITKEPTSDTDGVKTYTCLVCNAVKTEPESSSEGETTEPESTSEGTLNTTGDPDNESTKEASATVKETSEQKENQKDSPGFPIWAIILIAAVTVGGGATAAILIIIVKKNKTKKQNEA